jgi:hypothetical protein
MQTIQEDPHRLAWALSVQFTNFAASYPHLNVVLVLLLSQADIDRVRLVLAAQIGADVAVRAQRMRLGLWVDDYAARSTIISTLSPSKYACPSFASTKSSAFGCSESVVASIQSAM